MMPRVNCLLLVTLVLAAAARASAQTPYEIPVKGYEYSWSLVIKAAIIVIAVYIQQPRVA